MKPLRILGAIALVVAALSLLSASSASATVLCTNSGCTTVYTSGTKLNFTLKTGTSSLLETTSGSTIATCTGSSVSGKTTSESGTSISANIEALTWEGCSQTTDNVNLGSFSISWTSGSNGTVVGKGSNVTLGVFGVSCTYGTGEGTTLGTLTGGEVPALAINAVLLRSAGNTILCPASGRWTAEYIVTEPHALFVGKEKGSEPTSTTLTTSLSGESKSGEEITVNEGSKVKDTATLSGTNASKATGTVKYKVYSDKECKELVTNAGEVSVTSGSVPASEEKTLEAGRVYYWQAEYSGDTNNLSSKSTCGKEVLTVKAATSISTTLSAEEEGEGEEEELIEGEEIIVLEGTAVKGTATLSGTNSSTATGTVSYNLYADSKCEELVAGAGEVSVEAGEVPSSEEVEMEEGTYYWQAEYSGDALHQASKSVCGLEVLLVAKFEGPSWLSNKKRMPQGENVVLVAATDEAGLELDIGESQVQCSAGAGAYNAIGSRPNRVGKASMVMLLSGCKVLGAATSCTVTGFAANEEPLVGAGNALIGLSGELVWRGTSGQRAEDGSLLSGLFSFGIKKGVITTLKFEETGLEGCPPNLRGALGSKVVSITGSVFADLLKEEPPPGSGSYAWLSPNENVETFVLGFAPAAKEVEGWEWVTRMYQVLEVKAEAGGENAAMFGFVIAKEGGKEVGTLVG